MQHERRNGIIEKIMTAGTVKIADLTREYGVSIETIRRDLKYLEERGYLNCVYGGAVSNKAFGREPAYEYREVANLAEKQAIAALAASYIEDGAIVYLDVGTTVLEVAHCLYPRKNLTVMTNALKAAESILAGEGNRVVLLGGVLRGGELSVSGFLAEQNMGLFHVDTAILGVGGITLDGITDYHMEEANLRRSILNRANKVIAVADHSKFGDVAMNWICPLSRISLLITDWQTPGKLLAEYRAAGLEVAVASPAEK